MGKMADEEFVDEVDGPEDVVDDQQNDRVVVMPADQEGIDAEDAVEYACIAVVHGTNRIKSMPINEKSLLAEAFLILGYF